MRNIFTSFAAVMLGSSAVSAAELTPLPIDLPPSFSDDVDGGDFQERQANLPCGADTLKATLRIDSLHIDKRWASSLRIGLYEEGKRNDGNRDFSKRYVSLILGLVDEGGPLKFELNKKEGRDVLQRMTFSVHEALSRTFPVEAIWTADGTINFSIGGQPLKPITLGHAPASVTFVISGAKGEFSNVQAGRSGPPEVACTASAATP
jgi:hypothetical protein